LIASGENRKIGLTAVDSRKAYLSAFASAWTKSANWLVPVLVALATVILGQTGLFRILDGMAFDFITAREAPASPRVIIVDPDREFLQRDENRQIELATKALALGVSKVVFLDDPEGLDTAANLPKGAVIVGRRVEQIPGSSSWRFAGQISSDAIATDAARALTVAEYGVYRRQLSGLKSVGKTIPTLETAAVEGDASALPYYVRMPRAQNIPRIAASQLLDDDIAAKELRGMIALIPVPSPGLGQVPGKTVHNGSRALPEEEFRALAIQTLADGRQVRAANRWQTILLVLTLCLLASGFYQRFDPKRIIVPATGAVTLALIATVYLALQFGNILLPLTALLFSQGLLAAIVIHRSEIEQDRFLSKQVDRAVSVAFLRGVFDNQARLPAFLLDSAKMLNFRHMLLLERRANGEIQELGAVEAKLADLTASKANLNRYFAEARQSLRACDAEGLVTDWDGPVWIAWLGGTERDIFWLYSFAGTNKQLRGERLAAAMISSYRQLQRLRGSLSAGDGRGASFLSIDDKVTSALDLITGHDEQVRNGLDVLDTSVVIFHLLGYPLHANASMVRLFEEVELSLTDTTLQEALVELTELDAERISKMLHELLFRGGELRVPCRPIAAKSIVLRIAAPFRVAKGSERVIVVEAINTTNLKRLADMRLSISNFVDSQLRNDLEAITLGASIAEESGQGSARIIKLIAQAAQRAKNSLEEVAVHLGDSSDEVLGLAYPVDAVEVVRRAVARAEAFANDLKVSIVATTPEIGGYTIAEPVALEAMLEAMLLITIAETQPGDAVEITVEEESNRTHIRLQGGFGVSFESLCAALDSPDTGAPQEYRAISTGIRLALGWRANVSYWSHIGKGYRFNIELRRIA
jgi:CHASE2 domain-containing sensor protein